MPSIINATTTNGVAISPDNSGSLQLATNNGTTAVTIDTSQNVGIGTSSPTTRLNVVNTSYSGSSPPYGIVSSVIGGTTLDNNWGHFVVSQASTTNGDGGKITFGYGSTPGSDLNPIAAITASKQGDFFGNLLFFTRPSGGSNTERMRIGSDGNVAIGSTNALGRLYVQASTNSLSTAGGTARFDSSNSGDVGNTAVYISKFDNNTTTSQLFVRFLINNGNNGSGQINANGSGSAAFGTFSDSRLKENIVDLPSQLENIKALRPVEFDYIESEGGGHQIGFIAQEMQEVYPDAVGERADGMLSITGWDKTTARLVKAIQELKAELDTVKAELNTLKNPPVEGTE